LKFMSQSAPQDMRVILRRFEEPDEVRRMEKGRYEVERIAVRFLAPRHIRARLAVVRTRRALRGRNPLRRRAPGAGRPGHGRIR
jgi:hypothetical protein